jgi:hypothetical protein
VGAAQTPGEFADVSATRIELVGCPFACDYKVGPVQADHEDQGQRPCCKACEGGSGWAHVFVSCQFAAPRKIIIMAELCSNKAGAACQSMFSYLVTGVGENAEGGDEI